MAADGGRNPCSLGVWLSAAFIGKVGGRRKDKRQRTCLVCAVSWQEDEVALGEIL